MTGFKIAISFVLLVNSLGNCSQQSDSIRDSEERAYDRAVSVKKADQRVAALEKFLEAFPGTSRKFQVLEFLLRDYQSLKSLDGAVHTAKKMLEVDPQNLTALGYLSYSCRYADNFFSDAAFREFRAECDSYARQGLQVLDSGNKPLGLTDSDFAELNAKLGFAFHQSLGIASIQNGEYASAQTHLQSAVDLSPSEFSAVYPLALAYLNAPHPECDGLWYAARASILAPTAKDRLRLREWAKQKYLELHGDVDGWTHLLDTAAGLTRKPRTLEISCH